MNEIREPYVHRRAPKKTKGQIKRQEMFARLRENPKDPEVLEYLRRKRISYISLSHNGRKVEVRV